jgi:hypothetical protein
MTVCSKKRTNSISVTRSSHLMYTSINKSLPASNFQSQFQTIKATLQTNPNALPAHVKVNAMISAAIGAIFGVLISLIVNSTMVEISVSPFFASYFAILFLSVGGVILWRVVAVTQYQPLTSEETLRRNQLIVFASLIIGSGILCFLLERHWFVGIPSFVKIPVYMILGISVSFALTFALVDLLNYMGGFFQLSFARPIIESPSQVFLVLASSLTMGGLFGFIFGLMDVEDQTQYTLQLVLMKEQHYCYPIGIAIGGIAGWASEILRAKGEEYSGLAGTEFDEDI